MEVPKSCLKMPKVATNCHNLQKVVKIFKKFPKSAYKLPKGGHKLPKVDNSWQKCLQVAKSCKKLTKVDTNWHWQVAKKLAKGCHKLLQKVAKNCHKLSKVGTSYKKLQKVDKKMPKIAQNCHKLSTLSNFLKVVEIINIARGTTDPGYWLHILNKSLS